MRRLLLSLICIAALATPAAASAAALRSVLLVGDSLAVGIKDTLPNYLPKHNVTSDAKVGRTLATGMSIINSRRLPKTVAVSLFTNDDPRNVATLADAVRHTLNHQGDGCVIWSTIARPSVAGVSYDSANHALHKLAAAHPSRLFIVDWATAVGAHRSWMGPDGVHPNSAGYLARARMYAHAIHDCQRARDRRGVTR
jgi:hypothetical protein